MLRRACRRLLDGPSWLVFLVLCAGFSVFGLGTLNLFNTFSANAELIRQHGLMALEDGAAAQLLELLVTLAVSMAGYVVFKACEHRLVHRLSNLARSESTS